ncbi:DUF3613 domain-containing protein [Pandoraea sp.]|uniref:DUF3613 domain-containing protein n=1 Tax=Pandoraea sp. TaxID=1883445 RepID=UPI001227C988|nr:DUF3613 domain-containing protein [Pandoraea sp.]TAL54713.1 MAG: DUF3613 domain-containing protein [Pandoraea sp.]TAM18519.1 MAG: DUF3613 domain-containing protein [Pandoraea sp.]
MTTPLNKLSMALLTTAWLGCAPAWAQPAPPLTGTMMQMPTQTQTRPPAAPIAAAPAQPPRHHAELGGTTRQLLQAQADGRWAGPALPMLGAEASASYRRYLDSFRHPIPEFFSSKVSGTSGSQSR